MNQHLGGFTRDYGERATMIGPRSFHFDIGRLLRLALCIGGIGMLCSLPANGQAAPPAPAATQPHPPAVNPWRAPRLSQFDIFAGYAYWKPSGSLQNGNQFNSINTGLAVNASYFFTKHFGVTAGYGLHPETTNDGVATFSGGVVYRLPVANFTPFVHLMGGEAHITGANIPTIGTSSFFYNRAQYGSLILGGGGLDYEAPWKHHRFAIRVLGVDYEHIEKDFGPIEQTSGGDAKVNTVRLSAGLVVHFGNKAPAPRVEYSCTTTPGIIYPGETVQVAGTVEGADPDLPVTYTWNVSGGKFTAHQNTLTIDTSGLAAGNYFITGRAHQGPKPHQNAACRESFIIRQYGPPTISCSADPERVLAGQPIIIHADAKTEAPYKLTYSYKTTAGTLTKTGDTATLQTTAVDVGIVRIHCTATDETGQSASALAIAVVDPIAVPPPPKSQRLCSLNFAHDRRRPERVDNEAKACLDDIALNLQHYSDNKLFIVGDSDPCENGDTMAVQRAANAGNYLVKQKGIDPARIEYRLGQSKAKQVDNYLVPPGANFNQDVPGTAPIEQSHLKP